MRRLVLWSAVLSLAGCGVVFERSSEVVDLRVLAISAEPPEIVADGVPPPSVTVRALIVDPRDPARVTEQEWRACTPAPSIGDGGASGPPVDVGAGAPPVDDTPDGRCSEKESSNVLSKAAAPIGEVSLHVPIPGSLLDQIAAVGAGGAPLSLYVTTQLRVLGPDGPLYAIKRVPVSPPVPVGRQANRNPRLLGLTFNGEPWDEGQPLEIAPDSCPPERRQAVVYRTHPDKELALCAHKIAPVYDPDEGEEYEVRTFDGRVVTNKERMRFQWFVDHGSYSRQTTTEPTTVGVELVDPTSTSWREPPEVPAGRRATFWIVMRDGRGGVTWTTRELVWKP